MALRSIEAKVMSPKYPSIRIGLNGTSATLSPLEVSAIVKAGMDISDLLPEKPYIELLVEDPQTIADKSRIRASRRRSARMYSRREPWSVGQKTTEKPLTRLADRRGVTSWEELNDQPWTEADLKYDLDELYDRYNAKALRKADPVEWPNNNGLDEV